MTLKLERLIDYLQDERGLDEIEADTPLFSSGLLDSFALAELILFIEDQAGLRIPASDVSFENLDSPERITTYILSRGLSADLELELVEQSNSIVDAYSQVAEQYDGSANAESFWDGISRQATRAIDLGRGFRRIADVACGTGRALAELAERAPQGVQFVGVEPALHMRERALERTAEHTSVQVLEGSFEQLPLEDDSVDFLFSHWAFHWSASPQRAVAELARVLRDGGELDLLFTGRYSGREFTPKISPIYARYLGLDGLLASVKRRQALDAEQTRALFAAHFPAERLVVQDVYRTYHDTLDGHLGWWVRIEGHFSDIAEGDRKDCDADVRAALSELETERGIPYTLHMVHVQLRGA